MRLVAWFPTALVIVLAGGLAFDVLAEAYGAGPPHYDRTTNMDKWTSPWPVALPAIALCVGSIWLTRWALRTRATY